MLKEKIGAMEEMHERMYNEKLISRKGTTER